MDIAGKIERMRNISWKYRKRIDRKNTRQNASEKELVTIIGLALIYFSESTKRHSRQYTK